ncbi:MAG: hypothetical protein HRT45_08740 [Bdellovibrionales bacterium]|nr:hypothetical protein [Bdellovibrionales bacterium]
MTQLKYFRKALLLFALWSYPVLATTIFHKIDVKLSPDESLLSVLDVLTFPDQLCEQPFVEFKLHAGLEPVVLTPGVHLSLQETVPSRVPLEVYKLKLPSGVCSVEISYGGEIEYAPVGESSPGTIESRGVFLGGSTWWYPEVEGRLLAFNMTATVPKDWSVVSQGELASQSKGEEESEFVWQELLPQDDIYLIAAEFFYYSLQQDGLLAEAWLRTPDEQLAEKYLKVTHSYIKMYSESIGPYPYKKFALVENFWPTGFGMPSFTLLGSSIIRLPFILYTSYPHEVLHNWWGNGVYVDYGQGNWSEGLTSYQADHDFKAMRGQGHEYRRDALNNFSAYVNKDNDFPLAEFVGRFDRASSAIGYGKAMMLFHMLKVRLSESVFSDGIRDFYAHNLFQKSGYSELRDSFEKVSSEELSRFFQGRLRIGVSKKLRPLKL